MSPTPHHESDSLQITTDAIRNVQEQPQEQLDSEIMKAKKDQHGK